MPHSSTPEKKRRAYLVRRVLEAKRATLEPIVQGDARLSQIILLQHILVPHDELHDAKTICETEEDRKLEGRVFRGIDWVEGLLLDGRLLSLVQEGDDDESGWADE